MASEKDSQSVKGAEQSIDAQVWELAQQDKKPWWRKSNLRLLYLIFFPTCIGVEMTSG